MEKTAPRAGKATTPISSAGNNPSRVGPAGFTLIELVAVLVVAGLAAGLVTVSVARFQDRIQFRATVGSIVGTLRSARNVAILERTQCVFTIEEADLTDDTPEAYRYGFSCDGAAGKSRILPAGYRLEGASVAFFPKGYSTGGSLWLGVGEEEARGAYVKVDPVSGRVSVER